MTDNDFNEYHARRALSEEMQSQREFAIDILEKIKAEIEKEMVESMAEAPCAEEEYRCGLIKSIEFIYNHITELKGENQKTGHWIVHPKDIYAHLVCDKCLSNAPYDCRTNYCPNCGAKMEGE